MSIDKANLTNAELELTQKIQRHFPRGILPPEVLKKWNGCSVDVIVERCIDAFSNFPEPIPESLIELVGIVEVPATSEKFVARDKFVRDTGRKAKVKISYLGDNFREKFLGKIEESFAGGLLRYGKLRKPSVDSTIIAELGGKDKAGTTLAEMFALMEWQGNGKEGVLLSNDYANIFYIRDANAVPWVVSCDWDVDGWHVRAHSVDGPREWGGGYQVFYRNPPLFLKSRSFDQRSTVETVAIQADGKLVVEGSSSGGV